MSLGALGPRRSLRVDRGAAEGRSAGGIARRSGPAARRSGTDAGAAIFGAKLLVLPKITLSIYLKILVPIQPKTDQMLKKQAKYLATLAEHAS